MLRNFESVVYNSLKEPRQLKERSCSLKNIKGQPSNSQQTNGFDRVCNTLAKMREFIDETIQLQHAVNGLYVIFETQDSQPWESLFLEFCKSIIDKAQKSSLTLSLSIWDLNQQFETDSTTQSRDQISCYDIQFISEVTRLLNRKDFTHKEDDCRFFRLQIHSDQRYINEIVFLQTIEFDRLSIKDQLWSMLTRKAKSSKSNKLLSWAERFFNNNDYALYVMAMVGQPTKSKNNKTLVQFCLDLSDKILDCSRKPQRRMTQQRNIKSSNKENIPNKRQSANGISNQPSHINLLDLPQEDVVDESTGRTMSKIAMKRKQGFDRLLMQLQSDNRHLKMKLVSQKNDFERQTEEYVQRGNRKVGKLKVQIDELQQTLRKTIQQKQQLERRIRDSESNKVVRTNYEQIIVALEKQSSQLKSELSYAQRNIEINANEYDKKMRIYEEQLQNMRIKIDCLQQSNSNHLKQLQKHLQECVSDHDTLKQYCHKMEQQVKTVQQNQSKYLQEISRLEYRFLKERGKYIAQKNNNQKLSKELEIMDDKLHQIIAIKNRQITDLTEDSSCN